MIDMRILDSNSLVPETIRILEPRWFACRGGEMADAYASGAYEATHVGSSPTRGT